MNEVRKRRSIFSWALLFLCLSGFFLVLGTYLQTLEMPYRITTDPSAAEQYDIGHVYFPFSIGFWFSTFIFFVCALFLWDRETWDVAQMRKSLSTKSSVAAVALGVLILASTFLPWVVVKATSTGQSFTLSGVSLIRNNYWAGDVMYLVFVSVLIAILYIPLMSLFEKQKINVARAFLLLLGGICIFSAILSVLSTNSWSYEISNVDLGAVWMFSTDFESPGIGLLIAAFSGAGLVAIAITDISNLLYFKKRKR